MTPSLLTAEFACIPPASSARIAPDEVAGLRGEKREVLSSLFSAEGPRDALPGRRALLNSSEHSRRGMQPVLPLTPCRIGRRVSHIGL